ncbi:hypothetical protein VNO77_22751 [Canavalia gladiata]|uniref:Uncharacterized protein n=1 Tax=Canavalia gladiata TaxID=3824 RepID=A0AAN9QB30_CANGL
MHCAKKSNAPFCELQFIQIRPFCYCQPPLHIHASRDLLYQTYCRWCSLVLILMLHFEWSVTMNEKQYLDFSSSSAQGFIHINIEVPKHVMAGPKQNIDCHLWMSLLQQQICGYVSVTESSGCGCFFKKGNYLEELDGCTYLLEMNSYLPRSYAENYQVSRHTSQVKKSDQFTEIYQDH